MSFRYYFIIIIWGFFLSGQFSSRLLNQASEHLPSIKGRSFVLHPILWWDFFHALGFVVDVLGLPCSCQTQVGQAGPVLCPLRRPWPCTAPISSRARGSACGTCGCSGRRGGSRGCCRPSRSSCCSPRGRGRTAGVQITWCPTEVLLLWILWFNEFHIILKGVFIYYLFLIKPLQLFNPIVCKVL